MTSTITCANSTPRDVPSIAFSRLITCASGCGTTLSKSLESTASCRFFTSWKAWCDSGATRFAIFTPALSLNPARTTTSLEHGRIKQHPDFGTLEYDQHFRSCKYPIAERTNPRG